MIGAFRSVYRSKVSTCIVEYVGQYCESKSVCCLSVDVVDESFVGSTMFRNIAMCHPFYLCIIF